MISGRSLRLSAALAFAALINLGCSVNEQLQGYLGSISNKPVLTLSHTPQIEGTDIVVNFNLSKALEQEVVIAYSSVNGTATSGSDYTASSGALTFAIGQTTASLTIATATDTIYEGSETFLLNLTVPSELSGASSYGVTINDDDVAPVIELATATSSILEDSVGNLDIVVNIIGSFQYDQVVSYAVTNVTASGADYTLPSGMVTFVTGQTSRTITLDPTDDALQESSETLTVTLGSIIGGGTLGATTVQTITIQDDDSLPAFGFAAATSNVRENVATADIVLQLSPAAGVATTVDYTITGSATGSGDDYTYATPGTLSFAAGQTELTISVAIANNTVPEVPETIIFTISNPLGGDSVIGAQPSHTLTIYDNEHAWTGSSGDGDWDNAANWLSGAVPTSGDDVQFDGNCVGVNCNVTISSTKTVGKFTTTPAYNGTIDQISGNLSVQGAWYQEGGTYYSADSFTNLYLADGITIVAGSVNTSGRVAVYGPFIAGSKSAIFLGGSFTASYLQLSGGLNVQRAPANVWSVNTTLIDSGLVTTLDMAGADMGALMFAKSSGASVNVTGTALADSVSIASLHALTYNGGTIEIDGAAGLSSSMISQMAGGTMTFKFIGSANQTISSDSANVDYPNIEIAKSGGALTATGSIDIAGGWTHSSGTFDPGTSIIRFVGASNTVFTAAPVTQFYNLQFIKSGGTNSIAAGTTVEVLSVYNQDYALGGPGTLKLAGAGPVAADFASFANYNFIIDSSGAVTLTGTFLLNGGSFTYVNAASVDTAGLLLTSFLNSVAVDSGPVVFQDTAFTSGTITITGSMIIGGEAMLNGPATLNGGTLELRDSIWITNSFMSGNASIKFSGSANQSVFQPIPSGTSWPTGTITVDKNGGRLYQTSDVIIGNLGQDIVFAQPGIWDMAGYNLTVNDKIDGTAGVATIYKGCGTLSRGGVLGTVNEMGGTYGVSLSIADATDVTETDATPVNQEFIVTASPQNCVATTFDYATTNGTAIAPDDFTAIGATAATLPANTSTLTLTVVTQPDLIKEGTQSYSMQLSNLLTGVTGTDLIAVGRILDDDNEPIISVYNTAANAGANINYLVKLDEPSLVNTVFNYATSDGTALDGVDYTGASGTVTINAGATSILLPAITTNVIGVDKYFTVTLSSLNNALPGRLTATAFLSPLSAIGFVANQQTTAGTPITFTVQISGSRTSQLTFNYTTVDGSATAGPDYTAISGVATIAAGSSSVTLPSITTFAVGGGKSFNINISGFSGVQAGVINATATLLTPVNIFRSIGPKNTKVLACGTSGAGCIGQGDLTIAGTTATFASALPDYVGVGDLIVYDCGAPLATLGSSDCVAYVHGRTSSTIYEVKTVNAETPVAYPTGAYWRIYRAHTSYRDALYANYNTSVTALIGTTHPGLHKQYAIPDPVVNGRVWWLALYADAIEETSTTSPTIQTSPVNVLHVYAPYKPTEVGITQRHNGIWSSMAATMRFTGDGFTTSNKHVDIDGLQLLIHNPQADSGIVNMGGISTLRNSLLRATGTTANVADHVFSGGGATTISYVYNNLFYDSLSVSGSYLGAVIHNSGSTVYAFNNTIISGERGIRPYTGGKVLAKNNIVQGTWSAAYSTGSGGAQFLAGSDYNISHDGSWTGGANDKTSQSVQFVDPAKKDYRLAVADTSAQDAGINLSADPNIPFDVDLTRLSRPRGAAWDRGAFETLSATDNETMLLSLSTSNVTSTGFDIAANFSSDNNANNSATVYYCNASVQSDCNPTQGDSAAMSRGAGQFTTSVAGLMPGVTYNVGVLVADSDGLTGASLTTTVTTIASVDVASVDVAPGSPARFVMSLTNGSIPSGNVTFNYATSDGTALQGVDYTLTSGSATIVAGTSSVTISVPTFGTALGGKTFDMNVSGISGAMGGITTGTATFASILSIDSLVTQAGAPANFIVRLSTNSSENIIFNYNTANGTAAAGSDYTSASGLATIAAGDMSVTLPAVTTFGAGSGKYFSMVVSNILDGSVGVVVATASLSAQPAIYIEDQTVAPGNNANFIVRLSNSSVSNVIFNYATSNGTAVSGTDYTSGSGLATIAIGETSFTLPSVTTDPGSSGKYFNMILSNINGAVSTDVQAIASMTSTNAIYLLGLSTDSLSVSGFGANLKISGDANANSVATLYYCDATLNLTCDPTVANGTAQGSVLMARVQNNYRVMITNLVYPQNMGHLFNLRVVVTDTDGVTGSPVNTTVQLPPYIDVAEQAVLEGQSLIFKINLSAPSTSPIIFNYTTANNTALAGTNYVADSGTITIAVGETSVNLPAITTIHDSVGTATLLMNLNISSVEGATVRTGSNVGRIVDKDPGLLWAAGFGNSVNAIAIQSDGKRVVGGDFNSYDTTINPSAVRLLPSGQEDLSFNLGTGFNGVVNAWAIQPDGKIIAVGGFSSINGVTRNRIARLNSDGTLDMTFDVGIGPSHSIYGVALQGDGKILIGGGFSSFNGQNLENIIRLNPNGSVDTSFVSSTNDSGLDSSVDYIILRPNGKIVVGGWFGNYSGITRYGIAQLNLDGTLDTSFASSPGVSSWDGVYSMALQPDGKVIAVGYFLSYNGSTLYSIVRINTDGSRDASFAVSPGVDQWYEVNNVAIQDDGKVVIVGEFDTYNGVSRRNIARINSDGSLDATFNVGAGFNDDAYEVAIDGDGKILVGGQFKSYDGVTQNSIARLNADGSLDTTFNVGGTGLGSSTSSYVYGMLLQHDGRILLGGSFTSYNGAPAGRIARMNSDGSYDSTFNVGTGFNSSVNALTILSDDSILVGGGFSSFNGFSKNGLLRLSSDGTADTTFNPSGVGFSTNSYINSISLQSDNKIMIGGSFTTYNAVSRANIARINSDGSLDATFNPGTGFNSSIYQVTVQPDGKILAGSTYVTNYNGTAFRSMIRLNEDGTVDNTFSHQFNNNSQGCNKFALQTDGKIVCIGNVSKYYGLDVPFIFRMYPDGVIDNSFNPGTGFVTNNLNSIALQSDGKILIGGLFDVYNGNLRSGIVRINPDGSFDPSFDPGVGATGGGVTTIVLDALDNISFGGSFKNYNGSAAAGFKILP